MPHKFTIVDSLLEPPILRAAYSDRTAWLMAVMSSLAYVRFEQPTSLGELAKNLAREENERSILTKLNALIAAENCDRLKQELEDDLDDLGFKLVDTYNISIPSVVDTQGFLAELTLKDRDPMLILAFRGTEITKPADIKADISALPIAVGLKNAGQQVHSGFYNAFKPVQARIQRSIDEHKLNDLPLYITGHSLGGALAIVATYCISSDSVGACYTFGAPRVGNFAFGQSIKTPVYRLTNAADLVPRLPPSYLIEGIALLLRWLPVLPYNSEIADFLEKFRHYRHCGDLRYLTAARRNAPEKEGIPAAFPGLQLIANPPQLSRWIWLCGRLFKTLGRAGISDHSITIYVEKLAYWGLQRNLGASKEIPADVLKKEEDLLNGHLAT